MSNNTEVKAYAKDVNEPFKKKRVVIVSAENDVTSQLRQALRNNGHDVIDGVGLIPGQLDHEIKVSDIVYFDPLYLTGSVDMDDVKKMAVKHGKPLVELKGVDDVVHYLLKQVNKTIKPNEKDNKESSEKVSEESSKESSSEVKEPSETNSGSEEVKVEEEKKVEEEIKTDNENKDDTTAPGL